MQMLQHSITPSLARFAFGTSFIVLALFTTACDKFEYSPYQTDNPNRPDNLNAKNINELLSREKESDDTVRFIFTGDSQRFYDELKDLVNKGNSLPNIDFLILAGDISDFGLRHSLVRRTTS